MAKSRVSPYRFARLRKLIRIPSSLDGNRCPSGFSLGISQKRTHRARAVICFLSSRFRVKIGIFYDARADGINNIKEKNRRRCCDAFNSTNYANAGPVADGTVTFITIKCRVLIFLLLPSRVACLQRNKNVRNTLRTNCSFQELKLICSRIWSVLFSWITWGH